MKVVHSLAEMDVESMKSGFEITRLLTYNVQHSGLDTILSECDCRG